MNRGEMASSAPRDSMTFLESGPRLHYAEQGPPDGEAALLLLHGYTDSWFSFSRLMPLLPPRYRIVAPDLRGHGDSERPSHGYTVADTAADVVAFLDAVGIERAAVVGHSGGSYTARRVALSYPERVTGLTLIGSAITPLNDGTRELQQAVHDLEDPVPDEFVREFQSANAYVPLPQEFFERAVTESLKVPAHVWKSALDGLLAVDDAAELRDIAVPTLLLGGERDEFFSQPEQEALLARIPGARLMIYPETGHTPHWECPESVARDLVAFLNGQQTT